MTRDKTKQNGEKTERNEEIVEQRNENLSETIIRYRGCNDYCRATSFFLRYLTNASTISSVYARSAVMKFSLRARRGERKLFGRVEYIKISITVMPTTLIRRCHRRAAGAMPIKLIRGRGKVKRRRYRERSPCIASLFLSLALSLSRTTEASTGAPESLSRGRNRAFGTITHSLAPFRSGGADRAPI